MQKPIPKLVRVSGNNYTFFEGKKKVVSVNAGEPLTHGEIEQYRTEPNELVKALTINFYAPRNYVNIKEREFIYFDGSEQSVESALNFHSQETVDHLSGHDLPIFLSTTPGIAFDIGVEWYSVYDFTMSFEEV